MVTFLDEITLDWSNFDGWKMKVKRTLVRASENSILLRVLLQLDLFIITVLNEITKVKKVNNVVNNHLQCS